MMHISDKGLALIKRFEGFSPDVYVCSGGRRTIGYGHVIRRISPECPSGSAERRLHQALHDDTPLSEEDASDASGLSGGRARPAPSYTGFPVATSV